MTYIRLEPAFSFEITNYTFKKWESNVPSCQSQTGSSCWQRYEETGTQTPAVAAGNSASSMKTALTFSQKLSTEFVTEWFPF